MNVLTIISQIQVAKVVINNLRCLSPMVIGQVISPLVGIPTLSVSPIVQEKNSMESLYPFL